MKERLQELRSGAERIISPIMLPLERGRERLRGFNYGNALIGAAVGYYFGVGIPATLVPLLMEGKMSSEAMHTLTADIIPYTSFAFTTLGFLKRNTLAPYVIESFKETVGSLIRASFNFRQKFDKTK